MPVSNRSSNSFNDGSNSNSFNDGNSSSPVRTRRIRSRQNSRAPLGQPIMNRTILRLRTENLPFLPPIDTENRIHERRDFLPRRRGTRYRGRDRTVADYRLRTLRKRGLYPQADFRNVTYPTKFTGRPTSVERKSRRLSPVEASPIYRPVNNGDLFERWQDYKKMHGFRNSPNY